MIVVKLFGGLGNQLFQYAAGRRAALRAGVPLGLDSGWFGTQSTRALDLGSMNIQARFVRSGEVPFIAPGDWTGAGRRARSIAGLRARRHGWRLIAEREPGVVNPDVMDAGDRSFLVGYWQSDKYFSDVAGHLAEELAPRQPLSTWAQRWADEIDAESGVSLHVRRGDFAARPDGPPGHGVLPLDYYRRAMEVLDAELSDPTYFAFSDDPGWVSDNLSHPRVIPVSGTGEGGSATDDLALMSRCRSHIVANSSFSWWGAWLGHSNGKIVIAPGLWFTDPRLRSDDIVPETWRRL